MNITFFGQVGLPQLSSKEQSTVPRRVEALARQLVQDGHRVTVFGTAPYLAAGNYHGIELKRFPSLNPQQPGGWVYLVFCLISMLRQQPNVIHVHSYRAALLLALTRALFRDARIVWTIDRLPALPRRAARFVLQATSYNLQAALTTPSRTTQYRLLVEHGVATTYIPDGYKESSVPTIPVSRFGLRSGSYMVAFVDSLPALRFVMKAYRASKTRKKLIVLHTAAKVAPARTALRRAKQASMFIASPTSRVRRSLLVNAAAVIVGDVSISPTILLEAMAKKQAIIAINEPRYQETLGTAGAYFTAKDSKGLTATLAALLSDTKVTEKLGKAAATRAQRHFTWTRLVEEYHTLYAPVVRPVLLDSAFLVQYSPSRVL